MFHWIPLVVTALAVVAIVFIVYRLRKVAKGSRTSRLLYAALLGIVLVTVLVWIFSLSAKKPQAPVKRVHPKQERVVDTLPAPPPVRDTVVTPATDTTMPDSQVKVVQTAVPKVAVQDKTQGKPLPLILLRNKTWRYYGADPAYGSRAAAIADLRRTLIALNWPLGAIERAVAAVQTPGTRVELTNGMRLTSMRSGFRELWLDVLVDFIRPPTPGMGYVAYAEEWRFVYEGKEYIFGIPEVCNNTYTRDASDDCRTVSFNVEEGWKVRLFIAAEDADGTLPADNCTALKQGTGSWKQPGGKCDTCVTESLLREVRGKLGPQAEMVHSYQWVATAREQTFRSSDSITTRILVICLENEKGEHTFAIFVCPGGTCRESFNFSWDMGRHIAIPDSRWYFIPDSVMQGKSSRQWRGLQEHRRLFRERQ